MPIQIYKHGFREGVDAHSVLMAVVQQQAKVHLASGTPVAVLTDSTGGTADAEFDVVAVAADCVNAAAVGSDLADKATTEAAFGTVRDALKEVVAKYNAAAAKLGLVTITDSLGGTAANGTVEAVTVSVTGAATGGQATQMNTLIEALGVAQAVAAGAVNRVAAATGARQLVIASAAARDAVTTLPALTVSVGTAASPGVKKAVADAKLAAFRTNVKTIVTALNAALTANTVPAVVAV